MRIGRYKLKNNKKLPLSVQEYIAERVEMLKGMVEIKLGDGYLVSVEVSTRSEACYLIIENQMTRISQTISFRNHNYFVNSPKDYTIYLSRFDTWKTLLEYFMNEILPKIIKNE